MCIKTNFMKMSDLKYSKSIWWFKYCIYFYMSCHMTKPTKWCVRPARTQISLGIHPVWSESSLWAQWVAEDPRFLRADSEDSDQIPDWSESSMWTHVILLVLSCNSSYHYYAYRKNPKNSDTLCSWTVWFYQRVMWPKESCHEKTCLWGLQPGKTQTGLLSYGD